MTGEQHDRATKLIQNIKWYDEHIEHIDRASYIDLSIHWSTYGNDPVLMNEELMKSICALVKASYEKRRGELEKELDKL